MKTLLISLDSHSQHLWNVFKNAAPKNTLDSELFGIILRGAAVSMVDFMAKEDPEEGEKAAAAFGLKTPERAS